MSAWLIPHVFLKEWFWLAIVVGVLVVVHFIRRAYPPPFPRSRAFFGRHQKAIMTMMDIVLIGVVLLYSAILFYMVRVFHGVRAVAPESVEIRELATLSSLVILIVWSGLTGPAIGFLTFFQSGLTGLKRIVLLILCLLPMLFTAMALSADSAEYRWSIVQLGVMFSVPAWVVNGPSVLTGHSLPDVLWRTLCRLGLASGDLQD